MKGERIPPELEGLRRFNGHLGPYVVLGMRMGQAARTTYPFRIYATLYTGSKRPRSCMADGVQYSSCCTLGKSNIRIVERGEACGMFTDGRTGIGIKVLGDVLGLIDEKVTAENEELVSIEIYHQKIKDLFAISKVESSLAWPVTNRMR
jgi:formylmethanofuran dehydrogenase subunit E